MKTTNTAGGVSRKSGKAKSRAEALPGGKAGKRDVLHFRTFEIRGGRGNATEPREGSKRGKLYAKLSSGQKLSIEQIMDIGKENGGDRWSHRDAMDALRLLGKVNHCHLKYDDNSGKWYLIK